jgi:hypothetical protein
MDCENENGNENESEKNETPALVSKVRRAPRLDIVGMCRGH